MMKLIFLCILLFSFVVTNIQAEGKKAGPPEAITVKIET